MNKNLLKIGLMSIVLSMTACSQEDLASDNPIKEIKGEAQASQAVNGFKSTRSVVVEDGEEFSLWWAAGEAIGVYGSNFKNTKYTSSNSENAQTVTFKGGSFFKTPKYAYYPYSSANSSNAQTAVAGALAQEQTWNASAPTLAGDYKIGTYKSRSWTSCTFTFSNVLTYVKMAVNATGTVLEGDKLQSVTMTVNNDRQLWGAFTADLTSSTLTWNGAEENNNSATLKWSATPSLGANTNVTGYMVAAPSVKQGDVVSFLVVTDNHQASFSVTSGVDYSANLHVVYAMPLAEMADVVYMTADGEVITDETTGNNTEGDDTTGDNTEGDDTTGDNTEGDENTGENEGDNNTGENEGDENTGENEGDNNTETEEPVTPSVVTGQFTCATYNVDGLPKKISFFTINGDGPGSDGTKNISSKIAQQGWDFVGFSEDFAYHSELTSAMSGYTFGTHRGSVSSISSNNTDGLGFATQNATCSFGSTESWTQFSSSYGGITSGANTCIKKGFRHYVVTLADGVAVDVIITHMNTYSSSGSSHINAQHAQLKQIAQYINSISANNRPIILMGDTNCRYTRHDFQTYFWGVLNSGLTYADPWVEFQWNGVYPTYPSNSLMVSDATGTSDSDIICENTQKGEVVDKIIYINNPSAPVQIKANSYLRDYDNFNGLADHMPIVVTFSYEMAAQ